MNELEILELLDFGTRRNRIYKYCELCHKAFSTVPSKSNERKYCSKACSGLATRTQVTRICLICSISFLVKRSQIAIGSGKYCSRDCQFEAQKCYDKGGAKRLAAKRYDRKYPEKEYAQRMVMYALREHRLQKEACRICGSVNSEAHHEDYSKPLEVIWLCRQCHVSYHNSKIVL